MGISLGKEWLEGISRWSNGWMMGLEIFYELSLDVRLLNHLIEIFYIKFSMGVFLFEFIFMNFCYLLRCCQKFWVSLTAAMAMFSRAWDHLSRDGTMGHWKTMGESWPVKHGECTLKTIVKDEKVLKYLSPRKRPRRHVWKHSHAQEFTPRGNRVMQKCDFLPNTLTRQRVRHTIYVPVTRRPFQLTS